MVQQLGDQWTDSKTHPTVLAEMEDGISSFIEGRHQGTMREPLRRGT